MSVNLMEKIGLVLTGGGAKGAYHVGAIKALAELKIPIDAVSGASIGALNGAIIACSKDMAVAHEHLLNIWHSLAREKVIGVSKYAPAYLAMLAAMAGAYRSLPLLSSWALILNKVAETFDVELPLNNTQLLDDKPLMRLIENYTSPTALRAGLPMYASIYESAGGIADITKVIGAILRISNTQNSKFLHLQSLSDAEIKKTLLASAALPLLFRSRRIQGKNYTDGGQGDWWGVGGNTPVEPLVKAGCTLIIVVHLSDGSLWDRNQYPNVNFIEIRPADSIVQSGAVSDLLGFDNEKMDTWIAQGYLDAKIALKRILEVTGAYNNLLNSTRAVADSFNKHRAADEALNEAMNRINR